jgi:hypothetical protein
MQLATMMTQFRGKNQGFVWFMPPSHRKETAMNANTHYVVAERSELGSSRRNSRLDALYAADRPAPRRVYRWGVDGPWLLAWGSENARPANLDNPVPQKTTFKHWFRREILAEQDF